MELETNHFQSLLYQIYFNFQLLSKKDKIIEPILQTINEEIIKSNDKNIITIFKQCGIESKDFARTMIWSTSIDCNRNFDTTTDDWIKAKDCYLFICQKFDDNEFYNFCKLSSEMFHPHYKHFILKDRFTF